MDIDHKDMNESTGNQNPSLNTCGLFDDIDLLHNSLEDTESLDQKCPNETEYPLGLLDGLYSKSPLETDLLDSVLGLGETSSSIDNPFFEQFMELDKLFPELPLVDTLSLGFEVEQAMPVIASDMCKSDVVMAETGECTEVASPYSDIIDVVTVDSDVDVSSLSGDVSDIALSPEYTVDVVTVDEASCVPGMETVTVLLDNDQAEQITVVEASDPLTLLTQELTQSSSFVDTSELPLSTVSVDLDELFAFSDTLGLSESNSPTVDDGSESVAGPSVVPVEATPQAKRKRACSSESSNPPTTKKVKCDNVEIDKSTIRRLKNNVASKHARAARRQKEQELFKQEAELEKSNAELRKQLEELELLTTSLRKVLVEKLSSVTSPV